MIWLKIQGTDRKGKKGGHGVLKEKNKEGEGWTEVCREVQREGKRHKTVTNCEQLNVAINMGYTLNEGIHNISVFVTHAHKHACTRTHVHTQTHKHTNTNTH